MMRPHMLCTYPKCDCLNSGSTCKVADREDYLDRREREKETEPYCSICFRAESELSECTRTECVDGIAFMIDPKERNKTKP
jgi:hypothetical protein